MAFTFTDNFESYSDGTDLNGGSGGSGWSANWSGSTLFDTVTADSPHGGSTHVRATPTVDAFSLISRTFTAVTATGTISVWFKINRTGGTSGKATSADVINVYDGTTQVGRVFVNVSNTATSCELLTNDGAAWISIGTPVNNTYHLIEIEYDNATQANKYRGRFDGGSWSSWYGYYLSPTWSQITKIEIGTRSQDGLSTGSFYVDDLNPVTAVGPANLKSLDTNLTANIKSYNTNLIANIKSINTNV